ncbi:hypothetical protein RDV64_09155 [Acuticoccus sp. MNP-M23]|uniref:hypothetical protein n=1 Tax=Acuticoccus sp. MNP-M23 TaxID=3072793 RepID=UPI002816097B|nr:hypothetical protein [Acuticoccus sp. MNP-M23]WMS44532.1 hypothetical protein RDV64_09155 [Acuticoccus sp. MNP-M23]
MRASIRAITFWQGRIEVLAAVSIPPNHLSKKERAMLMRSGPLMVAVSLVLCACTSSEKQWVRNDTPQSEADQALSQCQYEADVATATIGTNNRPETWSDLVSEGVASGVRRGLEEADLVKACMRAKGLTLPLGMSSV